MKQSALMAEKVKRMISGKKSNDNDNLNLTVTDYSQDELAGIDNAIDYDQADHF